MRIHGLTISVLVTLVFREATSFVPKYAVTTPRHQDSAIRLASIAPQRDSSKEDFFLSPEQVNALVDLGSEGKEKLVNPFGVWTLLVSLITCPIWLMAMAVVENISKLNADWDPHREIFDDTGKLWSKSWLSMVNSYPTCTGEVDLLKKDLTDGKACLFVANHASWLDIPVLCTVLDRPFKFIAKGELGKLPCIGHQLEGGKHILIDRDDKRSQLRSFREAMGWLNDGVPVMAFPEGMRSNDGRLLDFKGGLFALAVKTQVPIVPITLSHTHAIMPSNSLFPVQPGAGKLRIHVHSPISVDGKTDKELDTLVKQAFLSTLPLYQHPEKEETPVPEQKESPVLEKEPVLSV